MWLLRRVQIFLHNWLAKKASASCLPDGARNAEDLRNALSSKLHVPKAQLEALSNQELEALAHHHEMHTVLREHLKTAWWYDSALTVEALLQGPVESVFHHLPKPEHVVALRRHPQRLRALIDHGMAELTSLTTFMGWAEQAAPGAPVAVWLEAMCAGVRNADGRQRAALKDNSDDTADASMLDILSTFDVSAVCGYYFGEGETGVHCLECTADTTCVMCMPCFRTSPCRFHKYRLSSAASGGMCDCGNPHMWKPESFCSHHGAHVTPPNPIDSLPVEHRAWITETIRGLVHLVAVILQVGLTFRKMPWTVPEMIVGGPSVGAPQWMVTWLTLAAEQLKAASDCGDGARRILTNAWTREAHTVDYPFQQLETIGFTSPKEDITCLEILFLFDLCIGDNDGELSTLRGSPVYRDVMVCVANCLPDSLFRLPYANHLCQYAEMISNSDDLGNLCVQVLNSVAVKSLMEKPPTVPSLQLTDSIVHRMLSSVLYLLTTLTDRTRPGFADVLGGEWLVSLVRTQELSTFSLTFFAMCVGCSHEASLSTILSTTCFKAFCSLLLIIQCNSDIYKDSLSSAPTGVVSIPHWLGCAVVSEMWRIQLNIRETMAALTDAHGDHNAVLDILGLRTSVEATLKASAALDDPQLSDAYSKVLSHCRVRDNEATLSWDGIDANTPDPAFTFASRLLSEVIRSLDVFLRVQRRNFCAGNTKAVLRRRNGRLPPVYEHELLEARHAVGTSNTVLTLASFVLRAWMMELGRRNEYFWSNEQHYSRTVANEVRLRGTTPHPPTDAASASGHAQHTSKTVIDLLNDAGRHSGGMEALLDGLLDAVVMPFVLVSQVEQALWRRNDHNVNASTQTYLFSGTKCFLEGDIFLCQVLCACSPAEDFSLRVLQRFTYRTGTHADSQNADDQDPDNTICGYSRYLRLMLTIVQDTSKSCNTTEFSQAAIDRMVANLLSGSRMPHSRVLQFVSNRIPGEFEGEAIQGGPLDGKIECMVRRSLETLAVGEHTKLGLQFRLKDTSVWRDHVDLYYPMVTDDSMSALHAQYRSIEMVEYLRKTSAEEGILGDTDLSVADAQDGPTSARVVRLPPTVLRSSRQYAEFLPPTRALLHTDAFLLPSFFVVHVFNENNKRHTRGERDVARVSEPLLVHAITALYLCVQDCEELSAALSDKGAVAAPSPEPESRGRLTQASTVSVDWPRVEEHLRDTVHCHQSFEPADTLAYLPLGDLAGSEGLRHKLQLPVPVLRMPLTEAVLCATADGATPLTTAQALHEIREHFISAAEADHFSVAKMIDHILLVTGLAQFHANDLEEDSEEERARREEASRRHKRLKERQSKLLQRMRTRCAKPTSSAVASSMATEEVAQALRPLRVHEPGYLHTKLLMDLATIECCVCRVTGEEPLMLLAHISTSGTLYHLRGDSSPGLLPDGRTAHGHFHACGHAAHMTCIEKLYSRLAEQWAQGTFFEGRYYLGPSEFSCPMCMMICNTVCVCPTMTVNVGPTSGTGGTVAAATPALSRNSSPAEVTSTAFPPSLDVTSLPGETLYEELRRCSVNPQSIFYRGLVTRCDSLLGTVAAANIGLNLSEGKAPLVQEEDPLQTTHPEAWELAETIRCVAVGLRLAGEHSLIGQLPTRKDLICLLGLLTSVYASRVESDYEPIQRRFQKSDEDMCLLLLDCLHTPRRTAEFFERHTAGLVQAVNEQQQHVVTRWLRADAPTAEQRGWLMGLLRELLCVTYLKLLLVEEPAHLVLNTEEDRSTDVIVRVELETPAAQEDTLLRILAYLLRCKVDPAEASKSSSAFTQIMCGEVLRALQQLAPHVSTPSRLPIAAAHYISPSQWAKHLLTAVLHQEDHYTQILTDFANTGVCSECGKVSKRPVMCCLCRRFFCLQPTDSPPELYAHAVACCGGLGLFLIVRGTSYIFVDAVASRIGEYPSIYTDDFGETDNNLARGVPLTRNDDDGMRLLTVWLTSRWGIESRLVKHSYGGSVVQSA